MTFDTSAALLILLLVSSPIKAAPQTQGPATSSTFQTPTYPNTPDGLQKQIEDILRAAKDRNEAVEAELIHQLVLPKDSEWLQVSTVPVLGRALQPPTKDCCPDWKIKSDPPTKAM